MFERYDASAVSSLSAAQFIAAEEGSPAIEPIHLLLGIARTDAQLRDALGIEVPYLEAARSQQRAQPGGIRSDPVLSEALRDCLASCALRRANGQVPISSADLLFAVSQHVDMANTKLNLAGDTLSAREASIQMICEERHRQETGDTAGCADADMPSRTHDRANRETWVFHNGKFINPRFFQR